MRGGRILWYENDGEADFSESHIIINNELGLSDLALADIDKDGDIDVFSTTREWESSLENKVSWYENSNGLGDFGEQQVIATDLYIPASIALADFDGDKDLDVICKSGSYFANEATTYWFENLSPVAVEKYTFNDFSIYPTVVTDFITIDAVQEIKSIQILNVLGELMLTELHPHQVNLSKLSPGTYFCIIETKESTLGVKQIIKASR